MANPYGQPPQQPFTPAEKRFLLGEIIKYYAPSQDYLWQVASNLIPQLPPRLDDMPMPQGRSLNEAFRAFEEISGIRRTSVPQQTPLMRPMASQSTSPGSAPLPAKRPYGIAFEQSYSGPKLLPKPSSGSTNVYGQQSPIEQAPKKKRGRPTKAEAQAKAAEAQSVSGDAGPAPKPQIFETSMVRPPPPARPSAPLTIETPRPEEARPAQMARMSVSSMLTPTGQKSASQSSSSSGKRRRGRSTRSEPEDLPRLGESSPGQAQEYESPYATRMGAEAQDSPARTAVLRHRDDADSRTTFPGAQSTGPQETPTTIGPPTTGPT